MPSSGGGVVGRQSVTGVATPEKTTTDGSSRGCAGGAGGGAAKTSKSGSKAATLPFPLSKSTVRGLILSENAGARRSSGRGRGGGGGAAERGGGGGGNRGGADGRATAAVTIGGGTATSTSCAGFGVPLHSKLQAGHRKSVSRSCGTSGNAASVAMASRSSLSKTPAKKSFAVGGSFFAIYFTAIHAAKFIHRQQQSISRNPACRSSSMFQRAVTGTSTPSSERRFRSMASCE